MDKRYEVEMWSKKAKGSKLETMSKRHLSCEEAFNLVKKYLLKAYDKDIYVFGYRIWFDTNNFGNIICISDGSFYI